MYECMKIAVHHSSSHLSYPILIKIHYQLQTETFRNENAGYSRF